MWPFISDKFNISTGAMKVMARELGAGTKHAVMAAMRHDLPCRIETGLPPKGVGSAVVSSQITWIAGHSGSGKTELIHAATRDMARRGYRSIYVNGYGLNTYKWDSREDATISLVNDEYCPLTDWRTRLSTELVPALEDPAVINARIMLPSINKAGSAHKDFVRAILRAIVEHGDENRAVFLDNIYWDSDDMSHFVTEFRKLGLPALTITCIDFWRKPDLVASISPEDAVIAMKLVYPAEKIRTALPQLSLDQARDCMDFIEGEGWLVEAGKSRRILGRYECPRELDLVHAGTAAGRVIMRLDEAIGIKGLGTHTDRLEMVARACGYRSWHAAQGRRKSPQITA